MALCSTTTCAWQQVKLPTPSRRHTATASAHSGVRVLVTGRVGVVNRLQGSSPMPPDTMIRGLEPESLTKDRWSIGPRRICTKGQLFSFSAFEFECFYRTADIARNYFYFAGGHVEQNKIPPSSCNMFGLGILVFMNLFIKTLRYL